GSSWLGAGEVLPHDGVPHDRECTLGELEALEQRGGARAHPPHGYRAGEVERAAQPGEPLGLVGPHVRLETRGLGDRVDRGEVTRDALDDVEVDGQARGEVVPGRGI